ncbi:hypothetical protein QQP08_017953 [Theobroma cacao]|nr:hypothetical protein QQP08_017953 [Theobroma cacao]
MNNGSCSMMNRVAGNDAEKIIGPQTHLSLSLSTIARAAPKATIMVAMAKKREARPIIILLGNALWKSSSLNCKSYSKRHGSDESRNKHTGI